MDGDRKHVVLFGECMLELQGRAFGQMQQGFGGDTLNTAVYMARCGKAQALKVSYATGLGDDRWSDALMERWQAEGIGVEMVRRLPGRLPGLYMIEVDAEGERSFSYWRDASAVRSYFEAVRTPLEDRSAEFDVLYVSGISLAILPSVARERLFEVMQTLRQRGALVVFDNNYRQRLWPDIQLARACFMRAFDIANLALVTADDHCALFQFATSEAAVADIGQMDIAELVIKRGADPTLVRGPVGVWHEVPTERVEQVVDSTAAGDSFAAGYLVRRLAGASAIEAAHFGNRLAARVVQHHGAVIPLDAMADFLK